MSNLTDAIAALDLTDEPDDGEMVADAIIIARLVNAETGLETFHMSTNRNISSIVQIGLITAASSVIRDTTTWKLDEE